MIIILEANNLVEQLTKINLCPSAIQSIIRFCAINCIAQGLVLSCRGHVNKNKQKNIICSCHKLLVFFVNNVVNQ